MARILLEKTESELCANLFILRVSKFWRASPLNIPRSPIIVLRESFPVAIKWKGEIPRRPRLLTAVKQSPVTKYRISLNLVSKIAAHLE